MLQQPPNALTPLVEVSKTVVARVLPQVLEVEKDEKGSRWVLSLQKWFWNLEFFVEKKMERIETLNSNGAAELFFEEKIMTQHM